MVLIIIIIIIMIIIIIIIIILITIIMLVIIITIVIANDMADNDKSNLVSETWEHCMNINVISSELQQNHEYLAFNFYDIQFEISFSDIILFFVSDHCFQCGGGAGEGLELAA